MNMQRTPDRTAEDETMQNQAPPPHTNQDWHDWNLDMDIEAEIAQQDQMENDPGDWADVRRQRASKFRSALLGTTVQCTTSKVRV